MFCPCRAVLISAVDLIVKNIFTSGDVYLMALTILNEFFFFLIIICVL